MMRSQNGSEEATPLVSKSHNHHVSWRESEEDNTSFITNNICSSSSLRWGWTKRLGHPVTPSERDKALHINKGVGEAAFLIRNAVLMDDDNPYWEGGGGGDAYDPNNQKPEATIRNTISIICHRICSYRPFLQLQYVMGAILIVLTFVEPPHWCRQGAPPSGMDSLVQGGCQGFFQASGRPADNATTLEQYYPNSNSMWLSVSQSHWVDSIAVGTLFLSTVLQMGRDGSSLLRYLRAAAGPTRIRRSIQLVGLLTMVMGLITQVTFHHPYVRLVVVLTMLPHVQRDLHVVLKMMPQIFNVLTLLTVLLVFYAWVGTVLFWGTSQGEKHFSSLIESMWTLYIMVTTANYPDVMMSSYNTNRWYALYFVSFMILTFFFLMNVILASVVNEYDSAVQDRQRDHSRRATDYLKRAYDLMRDPTTGRIGRETIMALFVVLNHDFPEFQTLSDDDTKLLFAILDQDGTNMITEVEFMNFGNVLLLEFIKESAYATFVQVHVPSLFQSRSYQWVCDFVRSNSFEWGIDTILVLNAVVIAIQSYPALSGQSPNQQHGGMNPKYWDGSIDTVWEFMETIFTIVYCLEVAVKIMVYGRKKYMESARNVFDCTITLLAVASTVIVYYPNDISDSRLIRMIVMARVLRLVRLLTAVRRFQLLGMISAEILPKATSVLLVLFFVMYLFACLGVDLYGGLITRDPANPLSYLVLNTDFSNNEYWANNFNDMVSAMNVLFNLLVVNNWTECEVGYEAVTQSLWVRFYFLAFHIAGVVLVNNLVVAFIINAFLQQLAIFQESTDEEVVEGPAVIRDRHAVFNASVVTGTKTYLSGDYIARYRRTGSSSSEPSEGKEHDRLRKLFTQTSSGLDGASEDNGLSMKG